MIHSGLDWSEDVGSPWIVIAIAHFDALDLPNLDRELGVARKNLGHREDFVFKHLGATPNIHRQFYTALAKIGSFQAHVYRFNRLLWTPRFRQTPVGDPCICDGIITLTKACPHHLIADQMLHIDLPRREKRIVDAFKTAMRQEMRAAKLATFADVRPRPDNRGDGAIVPVADMIAGEVRQFEGLGGPYLPLLGSRVRCL